MNLKSTWAAVVVAGALLAAGAGLSRTVGAPTSDRPQRIAVVNVSRIANEMKEKQEYDVRFQAEGQQVMAERKQREDKIKELEAQRGNFRPDSAQYDDIQLRRAKAVAEYEAWLKGVNFDLDLKKKRATMLLDDKIAAAVAEYASKNGIDIVLADLQANMSSKLFDAATFDQLMGVLRERRVIYASKAADISPEIISLLDSKYKSEGAIGANRGPAGPPATGTGAAIPAASGGTGRNAPAPAPDGTGARPGPAQGGQRGGTNR
jgi:Skp family chaperone for outer membrane proteins